MKTIKIIFWAVTLLLSILILSGVVMYFLNYSRISEGFIALNYPTYLIYPIAIAKTLGVIVVLFGKKRLIVEWAYAGLFFNLSIAFTAHLMTGDKEFGGALVALLFLITSYILRKKIYT